MYRGDHLCAGILFDGVDKFRRKWKPSLSRGHYYEAPLSLYGKEMNIINVVEEAQLPEFSSFLLSLNTQLFQWTATSV
ncbi:hypothetical protein SUGI_0902400 [Cryptomeria japonica]|nr:hypothetical protein SUGI_0902400 [Cryptomeria japonica]